MKTEKIPIRIDWIEDENGTSDIEIIMDLADFESSGTSIRSNITEFKKKYLSVIQKAREIDKKNSNNQRKVSTKQRWSACKILSDFNSKITNKFEITNYKVAYARDFGIPVRSIRVYLDFGENFTDAEIVDEIPYSIYAELVFRINGLKAKGLFESEKKKLIQMAKDGRLYNRNEYRNYLRQK